MKRDFELLITNLITNDIEIIHDYSNYVYGQSIKDNLLSSELLFFYLRKYIDNQIPFKVEFNYKPLGK